MRILLVLVLLLAGCSEYNGKYEFFVQRGRYTVIIEDANGVVIGQSDSYTGNSYVKFESETLTVYAYREDRPTKVYENHIVVGEYYYAMDGEFEVSTTD